MSQALKRALRTFVQAFIGVVLASGALAAIASGEPVDVDALTTVLRSAFAAGIIGVLSYAQNALEDADKIPSMLKS